MRTRKQWRCKACGGSIKVGSQYFNRVVEYGETKIAMNGDEYRDKTYTRYHISCAKKLKDLNPYEKNLLKDWNTYE